MKRSFRVIKKREAARLFRKKVGELFLIAGIVLVCTEIYLGWQDGGWNRYPLSMLMVDTFHTIGEMMEEMIPHFHNAAEGLKAFKISEFPLSLRRFLAGIPMATFFLVSAYIFLKWEKLLGRT